MNLKGLIKEVEEWKDALKFCKKETIEFTYYDSKLEATRQTVEAVSKLRVYNNKNVGILFLTSSKDNKNWQTLKKLLGVK